MGLFPLAEYHGAIAMQTCLVAKETEVAVER